MCSKFCGAAEREVEHEGLPDSCAAPSDAGDGAYRHLDETRRRTGYLKTGRGQRTLRQRFGVERGALSRTHWSGASLTTMKCRGVTLQGSGVHGHSCAPCVAAVFLSLTRNAQRFYTTRTSDSQPASTKTHGLRVIACLEVAQLKRPTGGSGSRLGHDVHQRVMLVTGRLDSVERYPRSAYRVSFWNFRRPPSIGRHPTGCDTPRGLVHWQAVPGLVSCPPLAHPPSGGYPGSVGLEYAHQRWSV